MSTSRKQHPLNPWNWLTPHLGLEGRHHSGKPMAYFSPFSSFYSEMDHMMDHMLNHFGALSLPGTFGFNPLQGMFMPSVNMASTDNEFILTAELPGIQEKDIHLSLSEDRILTIRGEKRREEENTGKDFHRVESSYGSFQRHIPLPSDVELEDAHASYENGILTVSFAKKETGQTRNRSIPINARSGQERHAGRHERTTATASGHSKGNAEEGAHPRKAA